MVKPWGGERGGIARRFPPATSHGSTVASISSPFRVIEVLGTGAAISRRVSCLSEAPGALTGASGARIARAFMTDGAWTAVETAPGMSPGAGPRRE